MIAEIGHFALTLALAVAMVQTVVPLIGAARQDNALMAVSGSAAMAQLVCVAIAFGALMHGYVTSDFSLLNVAQNSHTQKPMLYKVAGVWGNHEGSLLLWALILALFGAAVPVAGRNLPAPLRARALAVQAAIAVGFLLFILFTSNPFERLYPAPTDGAGLNPMLQDPGLAFHPPFLYLGYVGFSMAFSFAVAGLIEGRIDAAWARWVRPWTLAAWIALTLGIALGSWWAYYTLGWGGWWYWDPVENASLMPWLAGTALLHSILVVEKRESLKSWTVLLAIITFGLSLLGTFLVRSGVLTSVHAFATDPARGAFVLILLLVVVGGSLALYGLRAPALKAGGVFAPVSREGLLLFGNVLLATGAGTVLLGTLYPLIADSLDLGKVSVGPPFFNAVFLPLMAPLVLTMAAAPSLAWKRGHLARVRSRLGLIGGFGMGAGLAVLPLGGPWWAPLGIGLAAGVLAGTLAEPILRLRAGAGLSRRQIGMTAAHLGVALVIVGMVGEGAWSSEAVQNQSIGQTVTVGGYSFALNAVEPVKGPNYTADRADFDVTQANRAFARMAPERRVFTVPPRPATVAAIRSTPLTDVYAVIGEAAGPNTWITRLYVKPLVIWLWIGALMMAGGGLLSLSQRKRS